MSTRKQTVHICDFCGKDNTQVESMVAGPGVDICSECVELAADIVREVREKKIEAAE